MNRKEILKASGKIRCVECPNGKEMLLIFVPLLFTKATNQERGQQKEKSIKKSIKKTIKKNENHSWKVRNR